MRQFWLVSALNPERGRTVPVAWHAGLIGAQAAPRGGADEGAYGSVEIGAPCGPEPAGDLAIGGGWAMFTPSLRSVLRTTACAIRLTCIISFKAFSSIGLVASGSAASHGRGTPATCRRQMLE